MALAWLARIQMLGAAGVLLWLGAALGFAARDGFVPTRERYMQPPVSGKGVVSALRQLLPQRGSRIIAVLGRAGEVGSAPAPVELALSRMKGPEVEIRRCEASTLYDAARGAHLLCVVADSPENRSLDWSRLAAAMSLPRVADFTTLLSDGDADAGGIEMSNFGRPMWPAWLDPEFRRFVAYVEERIPDPRGPESGILLVPGRPYRTGATRSRWFLMLNYFLAPRRIYLREPVAASGYVMQYFDWVDRVNDPDRWRDVRPVRLTDRALSRLDDPAVTPARALSAEELAAAEELGAAWVLMQTPNVDFRLVDWELLPLERVRGWSQQR